MQKLNISSIKASSDQQVFARGEQLYQSGAITKAVIQENRLIGDCVGQNMPYYDVTIELDDYGVSKTECSCPYNFSGYCKHIVALLLKYANAPESFTIRKSAVELVNSINKNVLPALLIKLLQEKPDLYDWVELLGKSHQTDVIKQDTTFSKEKIQRIINNTYPSSDVSEVELSTEKFLEIGDAQTAIRKLLTAIKDEIEEYPESDYYDEGYETEIENWGMLLAESLLMLKTDEERESYESEIDNLISEAEEYSLDDGLSLPLYVANNGWAEPSFDLANLVTVKLNVLERQNKDAEFLQLAHEKNEHFRYVSKLMEVGKNDEAFDYAMSKFDSPDDALRMAKLLRELQLYQQSVQLAEKGLTFEGYKQSLAEWLAPIEETLGNRDQVLLAWKLVFAERPSLSLYQRLQTMSEKDWETVQPQLMETFKVSYFYTPELAQILLYDEKWDDAMKLGIKENGSYKNTTEIVADGLIEHRPKWVIEISKSSFDNLVSETKSKYYASAVNWLKKAKLAYKVLDNESEWNRYLAEIKGLYARRPSLQEQFKKL